MPAEKKPGCYRLLHTADWHLGKLLNDQSRDAEHSMFLDWLLAAVAEHRVDAIVLSGDVFDSANPPQSALAGYYNFVSRLFRQGNCAFIAIAGNHDSPAQLEAPKNALHALNAHVAGCLAENPSDRILCLPDSSNPQVAVAMVPFLRDRDLRVGKEGDGSAEIQAQLVSGIQSRYAETAAAAKHLKCPVIATGHLTVAGAAASDSEREIHIGGLGAVGAGIFPPEFAYTALGHLHRPQNCGADGRVRYSGSPIALGFGEAGDAKEVRILDASPDGIAHFGLAVPTFRKLVQIRTTRAGLGTALESINAEPGTLRPWVEVVVEDAGLEMDPASAVRALCEGKNFDVLKVLRGRQASHSGMSAGEASDDEAIDNLLGDAAAVFGHLLAEQPDLGAADADALRIAFRSLLESAQQNGPGGAA